MRHRLTVLAALLLLTGTPVYSIAVQLDSSGMRVSRLRATNFVPASKPPPIGWPSHRSPPSRLVNITN